MPAINILMLTARKKPLQSVQ